MAVSISPRNSADSQPARLRIISAAARSAGRARRGPRCRRPSGCPRWPLPATTSTMSSTVTMPFMLPVGVDDRQRHQVVLGEQRGDRLLVHLLGDGGDHVRLHDLARRACRAGAVNELAERDHAEQLLLGVEHVARSRWSRRLLAHLLAQVADRLVDGHVRAHAGRSAGSSGRRRRPRRRRAAPSTSLRVGSSSSASSAVALLGRRPPGSGRRRRRAAGGAPTSAARAPACRTPGPPDRAPTGRRRNPPPRRAAAGGTPAMRSPCASSGQTSRISPSESGSRSSVGVGGAGHRWRGDPDRLAGWRQRAPGSGRYSQAS